MSLLLKLHRSNTSTSFMALVLMLRRQSCSFCHNLECCDVKVVLFVTILNVATSELFLFCHNLECCDVKVVLFVTIFDTIGLFLSCVMGVRDRICSSFKTSEAKQVLVYLSALLNPSQKCSLICGIIFVAVESQESRNSMKFICSKVSYMNL